MKTQYSFTIEGFETKVDGMPIKLGPVSMDCTCEHSWFDMLLVSRMFKAFPKWISKMYKEVAKMDVMPK